MFLRIFFFHLQGWSYYSLNIPIYLYYIYDKQILNISGHLWQFACRTRGPCQYWPSPVPHPLECPNPAEAQGPTSPWDHQLLPHWGCSRARLQLPRTLPCLAPASVKPGPLVGPFPGDLWLGLLWCPWLGYWDWAPVPWPSALVAVLYTALSSWHAVPKVNDKTSFYLSYFSITTG